MSRSRLLAAAIVASLLGACTPAPPSVVSAVATTAPTEGAPKADVSEVDSAGLPAFRCECDGSPPPPAIQALPVPADVSLERIPACEGRKPSCQVCFDCFGWQLFVSMNWPALKGKRGAPDVSAAFGAPGDLSPLVWETYANAHDDVFDRNALVPWDEMDAAPEKTLGMTNLRGKLQADHNWLTDRDGNLVRYEIRLNRALYDTIREGSFNTKAGLAAAFAAGKGVVLPDGTTEIKAAWRVVPPGREEEMKARYKVSMASIDGKPALVALIGLHIAKKTPKLPQWAWATFEHEANAPDAGAVDASKEYNLFNASLPADYVPSDGAPPNPHSAPPTPKDRPVQVTRVAPIGASAKALNTYMQGAMPADSVWRHYRLVDVQWPMKPAKIDPMSEAPPRDGDPRPPVVANVTMETFMQRKNGGGGAGICAGESSDTCTRAPAEDRGKSSCIGCHRLSSVTPTFPSLPGKSFHTDYSALFFHAK